MCPCTYTDQFLATGLWSIFLTFQRMIDLSSVPLPLCLVDCCSTVHPSLTSSVVSVYVPPRVPRPPVVVSSWCRVTVSARSANFGSRAFAVAGPMSWNSLPNSLRESACDDNISGDCFKHSLKTFLFSGYWRTERSKGVYNSALYKCTFTYLLTY